MARLDDTASLIDYMKLRYGKNVANSADQRADLLSWLQAAEQELWVIAPWSWRHEEVDYAFVSGQSEYTLPAEYADVIDLFNTNGDLMQKLPGRIFQRYYTTTNAIGYSGTPTRWGLYPRESTTGLLKIGIWPVPGVADTTARIIREKVAATLQDSTTNHSNFPIDVRIIVALKALKMLAIHEGKTGLQQEVQADIDRVLAGMVGKDKEHFEGRL